MRIVNDVNQNSVEWLELRLGTPTASAFSRLVTGKGFDSAMITAYGKQLAFEEFTRRSPKKFFGNDATERGHLLEPQAREKYSFTYGKKVKTVGFCYSDDGSFGFSPDGLVGEEGMLEIKCLDDMNHLDFLLALEKEKKVPVKYLPQTQGQLLGSGRSWNDLYFFHPELECVRFRIFPEALYAGRLCRQIAKIHEIKAETLAFIHKEEITEQQPEIMEL